MVNTWRFLQGKKKGEIVEEIILAQTGVDVNIKECPVFPDVHIYSCLSKACLSHSVGGGGGDQLLVRQRIFGGYLN